MTIEQSELRHLLGHFATGVAVVTAADQAGNHAGVTINSFNSVSLSPELVLFSLSRSLLSLPVFRRARHYCVNFLAAGQEDVSSRFAGRGNDKWSGTDWTKGGNGARVISGALAHLECERESVLEGGDHLIFLCWVRDFAVGRASAPLIYYCGRYHALTGSKAA